MDGTPGFVLISRQGLPGWRQCECLPTLTRRKLDTMDVAVDETLRHRGRVPMQLLDELKRMHRSYLERYLI